MRGGGGSAARHAGAALDPPPHTPITGRMGVPSCVGLGGGVPSASLRDRGHLHRAARQRDPPGRGAAAAARLAAPVSRTRPRRVERGARHGRHTAATGAAAATAAVRRGGAVTVPVDASCREQWTPTRTTAGRLAGGGVGEGRPRRPRRRPAPARDVCRRHRPPNREAVIGADGAGAAWFGGQRRRRVVPPRGNDGRRGRRGTRRPRRRRPPPHHQSPMTCSEGMGSASPSPMAPAQSPPPSASPAAAVVCICRSACRGVTAAAAAVRQIGVTRAFDATAAARLAGAVHHPYELVAAARRVIDGDVDARIHRGRCERHHGRVVGVVDERVVEGATVTAPLGTRQPDAHRQVTPSRL